MEKTKYELLPKSEIILLGEDLKNTILIEKYRRNYLKSYNMWDNTDKSNLRGLEMKLNTITTLLQHYKNL
jgi:hypothetical protein